MELGPDRTVPCTQKAFDECLWHVCGKRKGHGEKEAGVMRRPQPAPLVLKSGRSSWEGWSSALGR